jgi:hypothetical protein
MITVKDTQRASPIAKSPLEGGHRHSTFVNQVSTSAIRPYAFEILHFAMFLCTP